MIDSNYLRTDTITTKQQKPIENIIHLYLAYNALDHPEPPCSVGCQQSLFFSHYVAHWRQ